ncbi:MAG: hypothetical protein M3N52_09105 [Actinomycetota bacterium]|nr:hypothetical protein [Actinomycetota bacterium]
MPQRPPTAGDTGADPPGTGPPTAGVPGAAGAPLPPGAPEGALLRIPVGLADWLGNLPPVPSGGAVTVSFSSPSVAVEHADGLEALGYRVVGAVQSEAFQAGGVPGLGSARTPVADFVLPLELLEAEPMWCRALAARARCVFDLRFGPVATQLADVLRLHP